MSEIKNLEPQAVWRNFHALTRVPRPSGHLEKVRQFLLDWAKGHNVEAFMDGGGNIVMRQPATPGMEDRQTVVMQAHMDMVPQKEADSAHDFENDPIEAYVDGEWVKARGTTLGADDGMGVAAILAVLEDETVEHGPIEALITADEETSMYGVSHLAPDTLSGNILLNLDNETMGDFVVGSAGGVNVTASIAYQPAETAAAGSTAVRVTLKGLRGGHSGLEICENRANANKLMARFLHAAIRKNGARLCSWTGGNMRNAIPRESEAVVTVRDDAVNGLMKLAEDCRETFAEEFRGVESGMRLAAERTDMPALQVPEDIQNKVLCAILACHDGVLRDIPSMPSIVETSSNLAIVNVTPQQAEALILARSSSESMTDYITTMLECCFGMAGMKVELSGRYGAWQPNFDSPITARMADVYKQLFGEDARVLVVHAGLECSLIGEVYPQMDMVSFGPTLRSPHTPNERCHIPSVEKFWTFLRELLRQIPAKA